MGADFALLAISIDFSLTGFRQPAVVLQAQFVFDQSHRLESITWIPGFDGWSQSQSLNGINIEKNLVHPNLSCIDSGTHGLVLNSSALVRIVDDETGQTDKQTALSFS